MTSAVGWSAGAGSLAILFAGIRWLTLTPELYHDDVLIDPELAILQATRRYQIVD